MIWFLTKIFFYTGFAVGFLRESCYIYHIMKYYKYYPDTGLKTPTVIEIIYTATSCTIPIPPHWPPGLVPYSNVIGNSIIMINKKKDTVNPDNFTPLISFSPRIWKLPPKSWNSP